MREQQTRIREGQPEPGAAHAERNPARVQEEQREPDEGQRFRVGEAVVDVDQVIGQQEIQAGAGRSPEQRRIRSGHHEESAAGEKRGEDQGPA